MVSIQLVGGLCNQIFQTIFIFSYAKKHQLDYCISKQVINPHVVGKSAYLFQGIKYCDEKLDLPFYDETSFTYTEIPKMDNVCFRGYFQSFKYSNDYKKELLKALGFHWEQKEHYVSCHIRRTDYLNYPEHHPPITETYLRNAIITMYKKVGNVYTKFKFYSDDLDWCKTFAEKEFTFSDNMVEFSENKNEIEDLQDASCCAHSIGSNSSYSLMIYWLNRNKSKVGIFTKAWFGEKIPHDTKDLIPNECLVL